MPRLLTSYRGFRRATADDRASSRDGASRARRRPDAADQDVRRGSLYKGSAGPGGVGCRPATAHAAPVRPQSLQPSGGSPDRNDPQRFDSAARNIRESPKTRPRHRGGGSRVSSPPGECAAGASEDLRGRHTLHTTAIQVVEAALHGARPSLLDAGGETRRPQYRIQPLGNLLAGLARQAQDFGFDLFNGRRAHCVDDAGSAFAGNCGERGGAGFSGGGRLWVVG